MQGADEEAVTPRRNLSQASSSRLISFVLFCEAVPAKIAGLSVVGALFRWVAVCTGPALTSGWGEAQQSPQETPHRHLLRSAGLPTVMLVVPSHTATAYVSLACTSTHWSMTWELRKRP